MNHSMPPEISIQVRQTCWKWQEILKAFLVTANNEGSTFALTTGRLFRILAKGSGLWNVHCKCYRVLHVLFIVLNVLFVATETLMLTICGAFGEKCVSLNLTKTTHIDHNNMTEFRTFLITDEV